MSKPLSEIIADLQKPIPISEIEWRVSQISPKGWVQILAYKNARIDMKRLDDVVGAMNWQRRHCRDNHNCIISIWDEEKKQWVEKEDTGTESNTEAEKGLASDSFKRAGTNWGIGRGLYSMPQIWIKLEDKEWKLSEFKKDKNGKPKPETTWDFKLKEWKWYCEYDLTGAITFLAAQDDKQKTRFTWGERAKINNEGNKQ